MSREGQVATLLLADATLEGILTGGIYQNGLIGIEGIRRGADSPTADAFDDSTGFLLPCAVVKDTALVPFGTLRDLAEKIAGASQRVEIYFYEDRGQTAIYAARDRIFSLLEGERFSDTFKIRWIEDRGPFLDVGPVSGATTLRTDYQIISVRDGSA
jgi:hypothetical protein